MTNLPHFVKIAEDNVAEFYLDHTLLSSARMCESRFVLDHIQNYKPKGIPWALDFGTLMHHLFEFYHKQEMTGTLPTLPDFLSEALRRLWREGNYDKYIGTSHFKAIGGFEGYIATLTQYYAYYSRPTNLRPIALEVPFGKSKEVPLHEDSALYSWAPFRLYLSGKLDFIFDDGNRLGPLDHKTLSIAGKNPMVGYEVQEGMTGYLYALRSIYKTHFAELLPNRTVDRVWMNYILTKPETVMNKKFQRIPLIKSEWQLEEWRMRQISTAGKIYQLLFQGRPPDFNASVCTNYWYSECHYQKVHRLSNPADQLVILQNDFKIEEWNPEAEEIK